MISGVAAGYHQLQSFLFSDNQTRQKNNINYDVVYANDE